MYKTKYSLSVLAFVQFGVKKNRSEKQTLELQSPELSTVVFAPPGSYYRNISGTPKPENFVNNEPQTTVNFAFDERWQGSVRFRF